MLDPGSLVDSWIWTWIIIPFLIFIARILDVSIGTIRFVMISKGNKFIAPILGFFEVIIWLVVIGQILQNLSNFLGYIAYGAGFATGNYVGMLIEERLSLGNVIVRIITRLDSTKLVGEIRDLGYGVTVVDAHGKTAKTKIIFSVIKRQDLGKVVGLIKSNNPQAFYSVENVASVSQAKYPQTTQGMRFNMLNWIRPHRKGK
jgi:uncharacterized protein YebE (UPF0316 family)